MASSMHDKQMGFKRRVRRPREGAEFKRVANAIHRITAARTNNAPDQESLHETEDDSDSSEIGDHDYESTAGAEFKRVANAIHIISAARTKDAPDQTSPTETNSTSGSPTRHKLEDDDSDSSEGGDNDSTTEVENDEGILYGNEENYAPIKEEESVDADVYIDDIDETEFSEDANEDLFEEICKEEDESEVSETEAYDETEIKFDEQEEEVEVGSVSIDETESEAGLDVLEVVSRDNKVLEVRAHHVMRSPYR
jgi:hypothetical protein